MKIAYLITAFENYAHLGRLIEALDDSDAVFYLHVDKKSSMPGIKGPNIHYVDRVKIWWGSWYLPQAVINLLKEAVKTGADYYVLLSGADYPIRPRPFLYDTLKQGGEFINIIKGFQSHKPEERVKYYYYGGFNRKDPKNVRSMFFLALERIRNKCFIKKNYPFKDIYHGTSWWTLSHNCVAYILNFIDQNREFVNFFKTSFIPDESFFHTIIGNSEFLNRCRGNLTFAEWERPGSSSPMLISQKHIALFKGQTEFESVYGKYTPCFARKFNDDSVDVVNAIRKELLNDPVIT